jgi:predicted nucleotidyltransferase component of viral defense system
MAKIDFYKIDETEKVAIFNAIATAKGMTPFAVEKDWWVSRTLEIVFQMEIAKHLVFKGGTSLSKAWKMINRFSEDIDLAFDRTFFGFTGDLRKNQRDKLRKTAGAYVDTVFYPNLMEAFKEIGLEHVNIVLEEGNESDRDRKINLYYPNVIPTTGYLEPRVQLEIGCRSLREPFTVQRFGSLIDEFYTGKDFAATLFEVPTVNPERTFLEKLFLLHEEFNRPPEKMRVNRLSRHLYDIYHLTNAGIAEKAINDKELYQTIVTHRYKFSRVGEVDYNLHNPKTVNPIPVAEKMEEWKADYAKMQEDMIYEENKPSFEDLISNLDNLRSKLQAVPWEFESTFPMPNS